MGKEPHFGQNSLLFTSDILIFIKASLLYIALFECVILFVSPCPFISEPSLKKEKSEVSVQTGSPTGSSPNIPWSSQIMDPNICQVFCLGTPGQWPVSRYSALLLTSTWRSMTTPILTQRMNLWKDSWRSTDLAHADIGKLPSWPFLCGAGIQQVNLAFYWSMFKAIVMAYLIVRRLIFLFGTIVMGIRCISIQE